MIDVGAKKTTARLARAQAYVKLNAEIVRLIRTDRIPKGNVLEAARFAGILAAKNTSGLIPLCHNLPLDYVGLEFRTDAAGVLIKAEARCSGKTGVEMEALVACSAAALTIYDMCKMFSQDLEIGRILLLEKRGGKSGVYLKKAGRLRR
jgi:cyclic pyranopterin monophosphate synthase